jgi:hypothetical protein
MAEAERLERGYLGTLLRLTLLAPNLIETILDGSQSESVSLSRLLTPFPASWSEQCVPLQPPPSATRCEPQQTGVRSLSSADLTSSMAAQVAP